MSLKNSPTKLTNKRLLIALLSLTALVTTIAACQPTTAIYSGEFAWLNHADIDNDIEQAIANKDYRLIAIAARGKALPGINAEQSQTAKRHCKLKYLKGLGDNKGKKNSPQRQFWQTAYEYAKQFNLALISYCDLN